MTDTALHADVVLPATTQLEHLDVVFSWGHHYLTWNEPAIEPLGEAKPNTEAFRLLAERLGLDDPAFRETDARADRLDARRLAAVAGHAGELRERGWLKIDLGQGSTPHAEGGFGTAHGRALLHARYEPPAEVADGELAERYPLALVTPKTHLFLNSTFANQARQHSAQPEPRGVRPPRRRGGARDRRRRAGARVQRPRRVHLRGERLRRRPAGRAGRADGLVEPRLRGRAQQPGHHLPAAHRGGARADLQRQPRRDRASLSRSSP